MKKWLVALCMCLCLFSLTACGKEETENVTLSENAAISISESNLSTVMGGVELQNEDPSEYDAQLASYAREDKEGAQLLKSAFESWSKSQEDIGELLDEAGSIVNNNVVCDASGYPMNGSIEYLLKGSSHDAILETVFERGEIKSITTNVQYDMGEKMGKAGLNTLLGMGTVFVILILISLIIALFGFIPKIQEAFKKDKKPESKVEQAVDNTIAQIVEKEELSDDTELVAVIAAAIASYESTSTDGFVVRSIRKVR